VCIIHVCIIMVAFEEGSRTLRSISRRTEALNRQPSLLEIVEVPDQKTSPVRSSEPQGKKPELAYCSTAIVTDCVFDWAPLTVSSLIRFLVPVTRARIPQ